MKTFLLYLKGMSPLTIYAEDVYENGGQLEFRVAKKVLASFKQSEVVGYADMNALTTSE